MKQLILSIIITFSSFTLIHAQKFAYVDTDYILKKIPEFKQAQEKLHLDLRLFQ